MNNINITPQTMNCLNTIVEKYRNLEKKRKELAELERDYRDSAAMGLNMMSIPKSDEDRLSHDIPVVFIAEDGTAFSILFDSEDGSLKTIEQLCCLTVKSEFK